MPRRMRHSARASGTPRGALLLCSLSRIARSRRRVERERSSTPATCQRIDGEHLQAAAIAVCALRVPSASRCRPSNSSTASADRTARRLVKRDLDGETPRSDDGILRDVAEEEVDPSVSRTGPAGLADAAVAAAERPVPGAGDPLCPHPLSPSGGARIAGRRHGRCWKTVAARTVSADRCFAADLADAHWLAARVASDDDPRGTRLPRGTGCTSVGGTTTPSQS